MDPTTATTVLMVLGSAFGVMFATMTTLMVVSIRVQHRESLKIRTEVSQQIEQAFDKMRVEFTEMLDARFSVQDLRFSELDSRFSELKRTVDDNHRTTQRRFDAIAASLADVRERLARVEGHLGFDLPQQKPAEPHEGDSNAA